MARDREQLVQEFFANFAVLKRQSTLSFGQAAGKVGLSLSQSEVLFVIKKNQPINSKELADLMQLSPGAVTQLVENLVQAGYLERTNDEKDRRVQLLSLSKDGLNKVIELKEYVHQQASEMANVLSDQELESMFNLQGKLIAYYSKHQNNAKVKVDEVATLRTFKV